MTESPQPDVSLLFQRISAGWSAIEAAAAGLDATQLTRAPGGVWSVKDYLAHMANWERRLLAALAGRPPQDAWGLAQAQVSGGIDALNALLLERSRTLSLTEVLTDWRETHERTVWAIEALSGADLERPFLQIDSSSRGTLRDCIIVNTYPHYEEHLQAIRGLAKG